MAPLLADGDYVLLRRYGRFRRARCGDVVCVARTGEPLLIKRLGDRTQDRRFRLSGDGAASAPSVDLGLAADHQLVGRAMIAISKHHIRLIRRTRVAANLLCR